MPIPPDSVQARAEQVFDNRFIYIAHGTWLVRTSTDAMDGTCDRKPLLDTYVCWLVAFTTPLDGVVRFWSPSKVFPNWKDVDVELDRLLESGESPSEHHAGVVS